MFISYLLSGLTIVFALYFAYKILTPPEIGRKHIVKNNIECIIQSYEHFTENDKAQLIATWINVLDLDKVDECIKDGLEDIFNNKIKKGSD